MNESVARLTRRRTLVRDLLALSDPPRRTLGRLLVAFVAIEAVLIALHLVATGPLAPLAAQAKDGHIGGFDLDDEATLAVWFSSFQLLLIAVVCLFLSWFDRRRALRVPGAWAWKPAALVFFFMAVDETAGLHEVFGKVMLRLLPDAGLSASLWWSLPYAAALGFVFLMAGVRLLRRPGRLALLIAAGGLWVVSDVLEHMQRLSGRVDVALEEGFEMLGATLLLAALGLTLIELARAPSPQAVDSAGAQGIAGMGRHPDGQRTRAPGG